MTRFAGLMLALVIAVGFAPVAHAEIADADRATIQSMITGQIDAFRRDDGAAAYAYASPTIRQFFPTPEVFLQMVQKGYPPVYRPQSFTFGPMRETDLGPMQRVFITGPDGASYIAEYALQRQPDGTWKINGCTILKNDGPSI